jgi:hypothetical protein
LSPSWTPSSTVSVTPQRSFSEVNTGLIEHCD